MFNPILLPNDTQDGFHTAKTQSGRSTPFRGEFDRLSVPTGEVRPNGELRDSNRPRYCSIRWLCIARTMRLIAEHHFPTFASRASLK